MFSERLSYEATLLPSTNFRLDSFGKVVDSVVTPADKLSPEQMENHSDISSYNIDFIVFRIYEYVLFIVLYISYFSRNRSVYHPYLIHVYIVSKYMCLASRQQIGFDIPTVLFYVI